MRGDLSTMAEWASLQPDLMRRVGDCVLVTSGVDAYIDLRVVFSSWRSAIAKPSPLTAVADLRFRTRQWVMLDEEGPLFLNVSTGRIRRLRRPVLHDFIFVGASDGLLVLEDRVLGRISRGDGLTASGACMGAPDVEGASGPRECVHVCAQVQQGACPCGCASCAWV